MGHRVSDYEIQQMRMSDDVTQAIAFGVTIETRIYRRQDYCPRVHALAILSSGFMVCEVLEGEEQGQVMGYFLGGNQLERMHDAIKTDVFTERVSKTIQVE